MINSFTSLCISSWLQCIPLGLFSDVFYMVRFKVVSAYFYNASPLLRCVVLFGDCLIFDWRSYIYRRLRFSISRSEESQWPLSLIFLVHSLLNLRYVNIQNNAELFSLMSNATQPANDLLLTSLNESMTSHLYCIKKRVFYMKNCCHFKDEKLINYISLSNYWRNNEM